ncbi:MAG TPA: septum formation initiator family protein [Fibrobacteraceae bacterium]|jgi:cell division protein FtsB|nr:hypothetical protein [Fibrobacter sp.]HOG68192.1 septum formation initiator family protein [Fibrobacteraceae bacterium]HPW94165.1 septum formation initiator family protein [Fibrobacteraceae bacterium]HQB64765.1 septum formation initiator family protein [Fibrobacteraceae bacterium]
MISQLIFGKNGLLGQHRLYNHIQSLEIEIDSLKVELQKQQDENKRLKTDSFYLEYLVRTRYGMSKKDELPIQFIDIKKEKPATLPTDE